MCDVYEDNVMTKKKLIIFIGLLYKSDGHVINIKKKKRLFIFLLLLLLPLHDGVKLSVRVRLGRTTHVSMCDFPDHRAMTNETDLVAQTLM